MNSKTKSISAWALSILVSLFFVASGIFKLTGGTPEMVQELGGASNLMVFGLIELVMVALFFFPRTGVVGALMMIAYLGGGMAVSMVSGKSPMLMVIVQVLVWVASVLRFPELGLRLFSGKEVVTQKLNN